MNLQRTVWLSVHLAACLIAETDAPPPSTMAENFEILRTLQIISPALTERMTKADGFRHMAAHSYQAIAWNIVFQISRHHLDDFHPVAQTVTLRLRSR